MKTLRPLLLILLLGVGIHACAAESELNAAFTQLKGNGATPFAVMLYGTDQEDAMLLVNQMNPLMKQCGDYLGYEVVSRDFLTKRFERIIVAIYFERFPLYMRIDQYATPQGKIWLPALVSKDAAAVLPFDLISAAGK